jgi:hypothetical protein
MLMKAGQALRAALVLTAFVGLAAISSGCAKTESDDGPQAEDVTAFLPIEAECSVSFQRAAGRSGVVRRAVRVGAGLERVGDFDFETRVRETGGKSLFTVAARHESSGIAEMSATYPVSPSHRVLNQLGSQFSGLSTLDSSQAGGRISGFWYSCWKDREGPDRLPPIGDRGFASFRCVTRYDAGAGSSARERSVRLTLTHADAEVRFPSVALAFDVSGGNPAGYALTVRVHATEAVPVPPNGAYEFFEFPDHLLYAISNQFRPYGFTGLREFRYRGSDGRQSTVSYFCRARY